MAESCDVVVIGAGLAGLQCARELEAAGRDVRVWESSDDVGGRIRTEEVDGFLVDRGFQVLNPAYPAVRSYVDTAALRMQPLGAGVGVRRDTGLAVLAHPLREPALIAATLRSGVLTPATVLAAIRWAAPAALCPLRRSHRRDRTLAAAMDGAGLTGDLRRVLDQFLAGVLLEEDGSTSNDFALALLRTFALGVPGLPHDGMRALPQQLADALNVPVQTRTRADSVTRTGNTSVVRSGDQTLSAEHVVVATDPAGAAGLTGIAAPMMKGVVTHWYAADTPPSRLTMLCVDGRPSRHGPLVNAAVISNAAPSYAPAGRHLIQASAVVGPGRAVPGEEDIRRHAAEIFGSSAAEWDLLARHEIRDALPAQPPPLAARKPLRLSAGLVVCGDHRDTASIQGALESGHRAAREILGPRT
ncbi:MULTISPECIES: NAD(P)/FAD-dependent oxidoreductase [Arthrobacter]|uniref:FAD-dependent oxidoreductase n=1 Tax=Arthrobacter oryzae TaxID=409290 RepID=A0A3N0C429_9MICC|nr:MULTISPECIES: NAD(P)/FAD-dependent oxidoreductase [Arthrobacter]QYF89270.1 FAD-dependent oxidoreductase [Arthrobacter sp. PAMC25284]RNL57449.1 FAD-dependent oxidoreductase [Arthrobacter oryzae]